MNLDKRHFSEKKFHDEKYKQKDPLPAHYKLNPTVKIYEDMKKMLGPISGKRILEYGCGDGWITVDLASNNIMLDSFDISSTAIEHTQQELKKRGLNNKCMIKKMAAESLQLR